LSSELALERIGSYRVVRLPADAALPPWAAGSGFWSISRSADELSIVGPAAAVPAGVPSHGPLAAFRVRGTLDFALVGIIARLTAPLAERGIPVFVVSTYLTDYLLVPADRSADAEEAWQAAGVEV